MPSKWIEHVKDFAKSKGMTYRDALKSADCKSAYKSGSGLGGAVAEPPAPEEKENISMEIKEIAKRGRPKKYATPEEAKKAKSMKTMESNKRKKAEKGGALPSGLVIKKIGGKPNPMSDPEFAKKYMEEKAKKEAEGKGLIAGYSGEGANGLTHIYPISHAHILQMLKHFEK
jgi:hypothetical protein